MRDWWLVLLPIGMVLYFIIYPDQLSACIAWAEGFIH